MSKPGSIADPAVRDRLAALAQATDLARSAYADIVNEPLPERLIAAARGETLAPGQQGGRDPGASARAGRPARPRRRRWHIGLAAAAGCSASFSAAPALMSAIGLPPSEHRRRTEARRGHREQHLARQCGRLYKLAVNAGDSMLVDVPASNDTREALQKISQNMPQQVRFPDLKPWGLNLRGARLVVVEGRPAAQLVYVTDNKAIGAVDPGHLRRRSSPTSSPRSHAAGRQPAVLAQPAAPMRSSGRPTSAISGISPTTSPGNCGRFRLSVPVSQSGFAGGSAWRADRVRTGPSRRNAITPPLCRHRPRSSGR